MDRAELTFQILNSFPEFIEMIMSEEAKIRDFILENFMAGESEEALDNDSSFLEKGIIDSMGVLELVAFVEEVYGIEIDDDELTPDNFDSVSKLVSYIRRKS